MKKSSIYPMPEYFDNYINLVDNLDLDYAFEKSLLEIKSLDIKLLRKIERKTYAAGKWTVNEIFQHLIDTERVFCYRTLFFVRQETVYLQEYDPNLLTKNSKANDKLISYLINEFITVRKATILLFNGFDNEDLLKSGINWKYKASVLAMGFTIIGHQTHHFNFIKSHYYPLNKD